MTNDQHEECPYNYWVQVQCQLEVCGLELCDFWQGEVSEYSSLDKYLADTNAMPMTSATSATSADLNIDTTEEIMGNFTKDNNYLLRKGMIVELLSVDTIASSDEDKLFSATYVYPPTLLYDDAQYERWLGITVANLSTTHPGMAFHAVRYWKLTRCNVCTIRRDREWFAEALPTFQAFWDRVIHYRTDKTEFETFHKKYKKRYDINTLFDSDTE